MNQLSKDEINKLRYTVNRKLAETFASRIVLDDLVIEATDQDLQVTYRLHSPQNDPTLKKSDWVKAERIARSLVGKFMRGVEDAGE